MAVGLSKAIVKTCNTFLRQDDKNTIKSLALNHTQLQPYEVHGLTYVCQMNFAINYMMQPASY